MKPGASIRTPQSRLSAWIKADPPAALLRVWIVLAIAFSLPYVLYVVKALPAHQTQNWPVMAINFAFDLGIFGLAFVLIRRAKLARSRTMSQSPHVANSTGFPR